MRKHTISGVIVGAVVLASVASPHLGAQAQLGVPKATGVTFGPGPPPPPPQVAPPVNRPPAAQSNDLFLAGPHTYKPRYDRIRPFANYVYGGLPYGYIEAPIEHERYDNPAAPAELPAAVPVAAALPPAAAPIAAAARPGHRGPLYVIRGCYAGDTPPRRDELRPECRTADLRTYTPIAAADAQERDVPKDSQLVTIRGCAKGRVFIVGPRSEDAPGTLEIAPGRRFRMSGKKELLEDIKRHERMSVELIGLVRKSDMGGPGGVSIAGGRVRIGGAMPRAGVGDVSRDPSYSQAVIDVDAWRSLAEPCADR